MSKLKLPFAPNDAAHYRKTARRDESGRPKKKTKTRKMPLSQVRLPGGEGKLERRKEVKAKFHRPDKSYKNENIYQGDEIGYDDEEN